MKRIKLQFFLFTLLFLSEFIVSDTIEFKASVNADKIGIDDVMVYTLTIEGIKNPSQPNINFSPNFKVSYVSTSSNFKYINGEISRYTSFIYYLRPLKVGYFTIPVLTYKFEGKEYKTRGFKIDVVEGSLNIPTPTRERWPGIGDDDFFRSPFRKRQPQQEIDVILKSQVSKKNVFKGEQIVYRLLLYSRNTIGSVNMLSNQSFPGFWQEWFPVPRSIDGKPKIIEGKSYQVYEIRKVALFPTSTGRLTISPLRFQLSLVEDSFSFLSNTRNIMRSSPEVKINVLDLPEGAKNLSVGSFKFDIVSEKNEIDINDILSLKLRIKGNGNIKTVNIPQFEKNDYFKIYPAKITRDFNFGKDDLSGLIEVEIPVTFKKTGLINFPSIKFRYFDPETSKIIEKNSKPIIVKVTGKREKQDGVITIPRTEIIKKGEDIEFIKTGSIYNQKKNYYKLKLFIVLLIIPFILNLIFLIKIFIFDRMISQSKAFKKKKLINKTIKELKNIKNYGEIFSILESYLSEKTGMGLSEINNQSIENLLTGYNVSPRDIKMFIKLKSESESSHFSPQKKSEKELRESLKLLIEILKRINNRLK